MRGFTDLVGCVVGGVGSFMLQLMIISFLQMHPAHHAPKSAQSRNSHSHAHARSAPSKARASRLDVNLGALLFSFLELYGRTFDYSSVGISINGAGSYFRKVNTLFAMLSPFVIFKRFGIAG